MSPYKIPKRRIYSSFPLETIVSQLQKLIFLTSGLIQLGNQEVEEEYGDEDEKG